VIDALVALSVACALVRIAAGRLDRRRDGRTDRPDPATGVAG